MRRGLTRFVRSFLLSDLRLSAALSLQYSMGLKRSSIVIGTSLRVCAHGLLSWYCLAKNQIVAEWLAMEIISTSSEF